MSSTARASAALIATLIVVALVIRFSLELEEYGGDAVAALWDMARFFTILTNTLVAGMMAAAVAGRAPPPVLAGALTLAIAIVGVVYHVLLADLANFTGWSLVSDRLFHYVAPASTVIWWAVFAPKRPLSVTAPLVWLVWPGVYCVYAVARGMVDGTYPYPFLNLGELGWAGLATSVGGLLIAFTIAGYGLWALARLLSRG